MIFILPEPDCCVWFVGFVSYIKHKHSNSTKVQFMDQFMLINYVFDD